MEMENLKSVVEALIFASESAITLNSLCGILDGVERKEIRSAVETLTAEYAERDGGFLLEEVGGGYRLRTNSVHAAWIKRLFKIGPPRISKAAMESLSIIAYRQPITRAELEAIRGVDAGGVLAKLLDKRLIKITGRKETPGRPVVYGTTKEFLETFDLKDLSCLPSLKELKSLEEEYDREEKQDKESEGETESIEQHKVEQAGGKENKSERSESNDTGKEAGKEFVGPDQEIEADFSLDKEDNSDPKPGSKEHRSETGPEHTDDNREEQSEENGYAEPATDSGQPEEDDSGSDERDKEQEEEPV